MTLFKHLYYCIKVSILSFVTAPLPQYYMFLSASRFSYPVPMKGIAVNLRSLKKFLQGGLIKANDY
ncbi:MAG: hypothetical protein A2X04_08955 [Bacteroidetes bacterium GWF2_41_9]|nr:MAG: hypothetical protein A2X03_12620 [Bacteroidetes bacterium GWA2_40_15]OFY59776.1 MAG: hypothetical protein A2X04_08955 [Bacteroidetes bacterium GWF2_41_9]HAM11443.1 hypothetical protein [Bacteroidales bacterium]HBH85023.1 hypothetical protein [Bacteroidales bacterium]